jgi:peptide/nickel transport system ATP-binding protein/oligopeptide transport system ATP-binding protein
MTTLFQFKNLEVQYRLSKSRFSALKDITLEGLKGETLGVVGESGCGKSTLAKALLSLEKPSSGSILYEGQDLKDLNRKLRSSIQMIFQDPDASLNPRMTVFDHLKEALCAHTSYSKASIQDEIDTLLKMVQLPPQMKQRYPYQLSGGQKQRVSIARALSVRPKLIVCDEPLSSLDVSISAQIIQLLSELQQKRNLAYLFITHDLASLRYLAQKIAVLYLGRLMEVAPTEALYLEPLHPYTQGLLSAVPIPDPVKEKSRSRVQVKGDIPSIVTPPTGCVFHTRCPFAMPICKQVTPCLQEVKPARFVSCHLYQVRS